VKPEAGPPETAAVVPKRGAKHRAISDELRSEIQQGTFLPGERLPSDSELAKRFDTSRLTIIQALRNLEAEGLVARKAGSGTFVRVQTPAASLVFGVLMPDLSDGEVFEPISHGIAHAGEAMNHSLLWGDVPWSKNNKETQALDLCRYFISRKANGVFFSPVELSPHQDEVNQEIVSSLEAAGIPIVLLDRCYLHFPDRSRHDLVGIDNRRAGHRMTRHLLEAGCKRVAFAYRPGSAATVDARFAGYREALWNAGIYEKYCFAGEPTDLAAIEKFLERDRPDGFACANDLTAAQLMHNLLRLGYRIPDDFKLVGINDVKYAKFLPVPLTTLHQPCHQIGAAALSAMLERLEKPNAPARDILLDCEMIVRQSCGGGPSSQPR
jgi:DNA-binding LacI/PurR family transcriptional regulator